MQREENHDVHLITAAVISLLANKGTKGLKIPGLKLQSVPSFRGILEHCHGIPGRHRFRIPSLVNNPNSIALVVDRLPVIPGVGDVICDARTGSVLVRGSENMDAGLVVAALARILELDRQIDRTPKSRITIASHQFWHGLDRALYERTGGLLTVKDAIGIALLGTSLVQIRRTRTFGLPPAFTLLWWFYALSTGRKSD